MKKRLGISIGDPNGIGPELTLKCLERFKSHPGLELIPIGDPDLLRAEARKLDLYEPSTILQTETPYPQPAYGVVSAEAGQTSASWVEFGIQACLNQQLDALVTAPIHKAAWMEAGMSFPGHTELLADRCNTSRFGMMLMGKGLRVMLATRHIPLAEVATHLSESDIRLAVDLLQEGLPLLGIPSPQIAICGLNPHAGDGGAIGKEEEEWIRPLIHQLQEEDAPVSGPFPADTIFHQVVHHHSHDAILALYHDQGLGPLKLWAFDEGVNVTLGLPIIRTSPDHGTAFGIAGKGVANPSSMIAAIEAAYQLCQQENPWTAQA